MRFSPLLFVGALAVAPATAQRATLASTPLRAPTRALALTGATVVTAPGDTLRQATVVVRDGRIERVGAGLAVPTDAERIDADSLWVYAGFVDAFSYAGVAEPEDADEDDPEDPDAPSRTRAGIQPERDVRALYDPSAGSVGALRMAGFGAAHVVPRGGMLPGRSALVLLGDPRPNDPQAAARQVLQGDAGLVATFETASGVYPNTPMAVIAAFRQLARETARRGEADALYAEAPAGRPRPDYDAGADALRPALGGDRPLYFQTDGPLDAFRALSLADEFGFSTVLVGLPDAAPLLPRLDGRGGAVFAPLALPKRPDADSAATDSSAVPSEPQAGEPGGATFASSRRTLSYADLDDETADLQAKRTASIQAREASPARLAAADVPFAFATLDVKAADVLPNLRRFVTAGLPRSSALAALTTAPAALLGVSGSLGTIEAGKLANLVVTDRDLFADSAAVRMVIVEGEVFEAESGPDGADPDAVVDAAGTWAVTATSPQGQSTGTMTIAGSADALTGRLRVPDVGVDAELDDVELRGNVLTFTFTIEGAGRVRVSGVVTGDEYEASADVPGMGSLPFQATKQPDAR